MNSIGEFDFHALAGKIVPPSPRLELIQRPGIPGSAVRNLGYSSGPFKLRSLVDVADVAAGEVLLADYLLAKGEQLVLVKDGVDFSDPLQAGEIGSWWVIVLDVQVEDLHAVMASVGGLSSPSGAVLICEWDLVAV